MSNYSIVEFIDENTIEIIPSSWVLPDNDNALWPKGVIPSVLKKYLKNLTEPSADWSSVKIRVLGQADTLVNANIKAKKAEDTSHLSSDTDSDSILLSERPKKKPFHFCIESTENTVQDSVYRESVVHESLPKESTTKESQLKESTAKEPKSKENTVKESRLKESTVKDTLSKESTIKESRYKKQTQKKTAKDSNNVPTCPVVPPFPESEAECQENLVHYQINSPVVQYNDESTENVEKTKEITDPTSFQHIKEGILTKIFALIEDMKFEMTIMRRTQQELKAKIDTFLTVNDNTSINRFSRLLPISSIEDFNEIEGSLLKSEQDFVSLIKYLNLASGETINQLVPSVMKMVMKKDVSIQFSGCGKKKKRDFSATKVAAAVYEVISKKLPNATRDVIFKRISKFLAESRDREGGRKERLLTNLSTIRNN